jgi:hypothetical protein
VVGLMIRRQLMPRWVRPNRGITLIRAVLGLIETVQYFDGRHPNAVIIAEIAVRLVLAAVLGLAVPPCNSSRPAQRPPSRLT